MNPETGKKIQELQTLEQTIQSILLQKQTFLMELEETQKTLEEIKSSGDEVYKIVSQLLIKSNKQGVIQDLERKNDLLGLRVKNLEKQESSLSEKIDSLRADISNNLK